MATKKKTKKPKKAKLSISNKRPFVTLLVLGLLTIISVVALSAWDKTVAQKRAAIEHSQQQKRAIDLARSAKQAQLDAYVDAFGLGGQEFTRGKVDACVELPTDKWGLKTQHECYYKQVLYIVYDENIEEVASLLNQRFTAVIKDPAPITKLAKDTCFHAAETDYQQAAELSVNIRLSLYPLGAYSDCPEIDYDLDERTPKKEPQYYLQDQVDFDSLKGTINAISKKSVLVISFTSLTGKY